MADQKSSITQVTADDKGKSKAENPPPEDASMDEDDNSSEEESGVEEEVFDFNFPLTTVFFLG